MIIPASFALPILVIGLIFAIVVGIGAIGQAVRGNVADKPVSPRQRLLGRVFAVIFLLAGGAIVSGVYTSTELPMEPVFAYAGGAFLFASALAFVIGDIKGLASLVALACGLAFFLKPAIFPVAIMQKLDDGPAKANELGFAHPMHMPFVIAGACMVLAGIFTLLAKKKRATSA